MARCKLTQCNLCALFQCNLSRMYKRVEVPFPNLQVLSVPTVPSSRNYLTTLILLSSSWSSPLHSSPTFCSPLLHWQLLPGWKLVLHVVVRAVNHSLYHSFRHSRWSHSLATPPTSSTALTGQALCGTLTLLFVVCAKYALIEGYLFIYKYSGYLQVCYRYFRCPHSQSGLR